MSNESWRQLLGQIHVGRFPEISQSWPDGFVDLVVADPPYNIGYRYDIYSDRLTTREYTAWSKAWIRRCSSLLKDSGSLWIVIGDKHAAHVRLILESLEKNGQLYFRNWVIWHFAFGQFTRDRFTCSHVHLFYCVRSKDRFTFNVQAAGVPSARSVVYNDRRAGNQLVPPRDTWYIRPQEAVADGLFRADHDTWTFPRVCGTHSERVPGIPCQLPETLLERIILTCSNPGDIVFDPFSGSGTTLAVARRLNRQWLGCELSPEYARLASERISRQENSRLTNTNPAV